jgi:hypothetical protein
MRTRIAAKKELRMDTNRREQTVNAAFPNTDIQHKRASTHLMRLHPQLGHRRRAAGLGRLGLNPL